MASSAGSPPRMGMVKVFICIFYKIFRLQALLFAAQAHAKIHIPHSTLRTPHSALRTPHSAFHTPHSPFPIPHSKIRIPRTAPVTRTFLLTGKPDGLAN